MKLKSAITTLAALVLSLAVSQADHHGKKPAFDLAGDWKVQAESDNGSRDYTFTFEKKNDKWAGKSEDAEGKERPMDSVKVDGRKTVMETKFEANGETGILRVTTEANEAGDKFTGKWALIDSSDEERMSGDIAGDKVYKLDLAGEWDSVAMIGEEEKASLTTFKQADSTWTGGFKGDESEAKFSKVTTEGKKVTCEFVLPIEGEDRDFRISAEAKSADMLEGKWVVFDESGQEGYSGKWSAKRKKAFDLAGTWKATTEVNGEDHASTVTIEAKDDAFTGKVSSDAGSADLKSVKLDGEKVAIVFPFGEVDVTIKAAVKEGKLAGKWSVTGSDGTDHSGAWSAAKK